MDALGRNTEVVAARQIVWWNWALFWLAWIGILVSLYEIFDALFFNLVIGLPTANGVQVLTEKDFTVRERIGLVAFGSTPMWCWIFCFVQIIRLSRCFGRGELLAGSSVDCLAYFGYGLFVMAIFEAIYVPGIAAIVRSTGKMEPVINVWQSVGGALTTLMAAVLVLIITRVFRIGIRLREDAELTI